MDRIGQLSSQIQNYRSSVVETVDEPWRSGLLAIVMQLQLALEAFLALRSATAGEFVATAERLASAQLASVRRDVLPGRPADVSEAAIYDRKADLIRLLDLEPPGEGLVDDVLALAREAIRDGDDLTLYCLASGPLDLYYRARRADYVQVRERILALHGGRAIARLLEKFSGPGGVGALVLEVKQAVQDAATLEEVQQALLRPKLDLGEDADELTPQERQEIEAIEQRFREVAALAGDLGTRKPSVTPKASEPPPVSDQPARPAPSPPRSPDERRRRGGPAARPPGRGRDAPNVG